MWMFIGLISFLVIIGATIAALVFAVKKNPKWKKALSAVGIAFLIFVVAAVADTPIQEPQKTTDNRSDIITVKGTPDSDIQDELLESDLQENQIDGEKEQPPKHNLEAATVSRVVDGDTLVVAVSGEEKRVRLILVDTPESVHPDQSKNTEYGKLASDYTASQLKEGQVIYLQKDVSDTDKYNRLLRYVWLEQPNNIDNEAEVRSKMYNAKLLLAGYAQLATYPPDVKYVEIFTQLQSEAREGNKGLWGIDVATPPAATAPVNVTPEPPQQTEPQTITVYITNTGAKYHRDGCRYLSKSRIPIELKSAQVSGYTACSVCRP